MQAKRTFIKDMTQGSPVKLLLTFSLPMLLGNIFQQFYNMVDSIVVGNFVGANALAAVGACGSLNFLFFSLCFGLSVGVGILISQYFGAGDGEGVRRTVGNCTYILCISSVVMTLPAIVFARPILELLQTPAVVLDDAVTYMQVSCAGIIAIAFYNGVSSILRALGDSKTPLFFLIVASLLNVVLDLLFVVVFHLGVMGVALATVIAQLLSALLSLLFALRTNEYFHLARRHFAPSTDIVRKSLRIGLPVALQNALIALSCIFLQSVVNSFGEKVMAAFTATSRIEQLVQQPYNSLGTAFSTYTAQNLGARKVDRVREGFRKSTLIIAVFSVLMLVVMFLGGNAIMRAFVSDAEVIALGASGLRITSWFYLALGMIYVCRSVMNAAGDASFALLGGVAEIAGRLCLAIPLTRIPFIGVWGIWLTTGITWLLTAAMSLWRYLQGRWKSRAVI